MSDTTNVSDYGPVVGDLIRLSCDTPGTTDQVGYVCRVEGNRLKLTNTDPYDSSDALRSFAWYTPRKPEEVRFNINLLNWNNCTVIQHAPE